MEDNQKSDATPAGPELPEPAYYQVSSALSTDDERLWSMLAYLGTLVVGFISPLVVMLAFGNKSELVRKNAVECLNFQIACLIGILVSLVLLIVVIGFFTLFAIAIYSFVISILGAIKTYQGESFRIPLNIRIIK